MGLSHDLVNLQPNSLKLEIRSTKSETILKDQILKF
jgi:hypothetical protein